MAGFALKNHLFPSKLHCAGKKTHTLSSKGYLYYIGYLRVKEN